MKLTGEQLLLLHNTLNNMELLTSTNNVLTYESFYVPTVLMELLDATVREESSNFGKFYIITIDFNKIK